jgi:hypothetical protein
MPPNNSQIITLPKKIAKKAGGRGRKAKSVIAKGKRRRVPVAFGGHAFKAEDAGSSASSDNELISTFTTCNTTTTV